MNRMSAKNRTLAAWIAEITAWQESVFTHGTLLSAAIHLTREALEVQASAKSGETTDLALELADVFMLMVAVAHLSGVDLEESLVEKMAINKTRKWGKPDSDGVVEHVRVDDLDGKLSWDGETMRWKGKTLLEVFTDAGLISDDPDDSENILIKISREKEDGKL